MFFRSAHCSRQFLPIFGSGTNYGITDKVGTTNYFSTPDSTALLTFRGSFTATFCFQATDWSPASPSYFFSYGLVGSTACAGLYLMSDGTVEFYGTQNGSTDVALATGSAVGFADGSIGYIRLTRNSSGGQMKIYKSSNGTSWTDITSAETRYSGTLYNTTAAYILGGYSGTSSNSFVGNIYSFTLWSGYDQTSGTDLVKFNPASYSNGSTFVSTTGETWTVSGNAQIKRRAKLPI